MCAGASGAGTNTTTARATAASPFNGRSSFRATLRVRRRPCNPRAVEMSGSYDTPLWRAISASMRAGEACRECGATQDLVIHHKIPRRFGGPDLPENLEPLCRSCHAKLEPLAQARYRRATPLFRMPPSLYTRPPRRSKDALRPAPSSRAGVGLFAALRATRMTRIVIEPAPRGKGGDVGLTGVGANP